MTARFLEIASSTNTSVPEKFSHEDVDQVLVAAEKALTSMALSSIPRSAPCPFHILMGPLPSHFYRTTFRQLHSLVQSFPDMVSKSTRSKAWFLLGAMYEVGCGIAADLNTAISCYQKAVSSEFIEDDKSTENPSAVDPRAQFRFAELIKQGQGSLSCDPSYAETLVNQAAQANLPAALRMVGQQYLKSSPNPDSIHQGRICLKEAVSREDPEAMISIAQHLNERGENARLAAIYYSRAARHGSSIAQNALGVCFETGHGVPRDVTQAAAWYARSAASSLPTALCNVGVLSWHAGARKRAWETLLRAVHSVPDAMYLVGSVVEVGTGDEYIHIPPPPTESLARKISKNTQQSDGQTSHHGIAAIDDLGWGISPSPSWAAHLMTRAAMAGHVDAAFKVASYIQRGFGCEQNPKLANQWKKYAEELDRKAKQTVEFQRRGKESNSPLLTQEEDFELDMLPIENESAFPELESESADY